MSISSNLNLFQKFVVLLQPKIDDPANNGGFLIFAY
jgi:hypothetical protein